MREPRLSRLDPGTVAQRASRERRAARGALARVGLGHRVGHQATKLSGSKRHRVAIARATVGRQAIVFADEPTGNLDSATRRLILDRMREMNRQGATLVVISHDDHVPAACTRRIDMPDGQLIPGSANAARRSAP
ncbi:ATP-binding cassette domain-containing protein [Trebonia kvetii]|uniref:ATP-binding cassette domain-containing protein n=1 Tax=Trebonia kvetii TaxID=2480626 RepID=UPI001C9E6B7C|nr:ATP-binding cassette domain-containing protein [Trebonia kvetii]